MNAVLGDYIAEASNGFASGQRDDKGVIQLRMNNVTAKGALDLTKTIRVPAEGNFQRYALKPGDILFNHTNSTELVGKTALFEGFGEDVVFSNHFTRLRVNEREAEPAYVAWFINHLWNQGYFRERCQIWVGQSAVRFEVLARAPTSFPSLIDQRRLAKRLKSQMTAVEESRRQVEAQAKAAVLLLDKTIAESFHGIMPLSVGRDEAAAPAGWGWKGLLELARLESGHTPSRRFPEYWAEGDTPWLALPDIRALDCRTATQTSEKTNALGIANSSARILPAGTVALCRTASVGYVTQFGCEMATSQHFANYLCGPSLHPRFLMWLFRSCRRFLQSQSTGSVLPDIYMNVIHKFRVCLPDLKEQQRIADHLDETFRLNQQLQSALSTQLEALDKLPGAFLREAFGSL